MSYPILVGQFIGLLDIADPNGDVTSVSAIRSGVGLAQLDARNAPLLAALDKGLREEASHLYPEALIDLDDLLSSGLAVDADIPDDIDPEKIRLIPRGTSLGLDEASLDFRLQASTSVLIPELVFWAWVYGSTCSSLKQTAELVSVLHPSADASAVIDLFKQHIIPLHRSGCLALDAALTAS